MTASKLTHPSDEVHIAELPNGNKLLTVKCNDEAAYVPRCTCETSYPQDLINVLLDFHGPAWVCEAIARYEDSQYIEAEIRANLFAFFDEEDFVGKRMLDFGCGGGSSTICLAKMLPETEFVGTELDPKRVALAQVVAKYYGLENIRFHTSPSGNEVPGGIGEFDFCMMSAVYEHLLPEERATVMPMIWSHLKPGGALFINQTPHRYYPIEAHSTGLPLLNYLPDGLAFPLARRMSRFRSLRNDSEYDLLRGGLRGGTEREILNILRKNTEYRPILLEVLRNGRGDRIDAWHSRLNPNRWRTAKTVLKGVLKIIKATTGTVLTENLTLTIQKETRKTSEVR